MNMSTQATTIMKQLTYMHPLWKIKILIKLRALFSDQKI